MAKIVVSSCLLGCKVRYIASCVVVDDNDFEQLAVQHERIPFCPEVNAGLPTPLECAEIQGGEGVHVLQGSADVVSVKGTNFSQAFYRAAHLTLTLCHTNSANFVINYYVGKII